MEVSDSMLFFSFADDNTTAGACLFGTLDFEL